MRSEEEIGAIIKEVSDRFLGQDYNLLSKNCNHFTSALCEALTDKAAPTWLNRAASIGVALPCVVPKEWVEPPDHETADGELVEEAGESEDDERRGESESEGRRERSEDSREGETAQMLRPQRKRKRSSVVKERETRTRARRDNSGRTLPASERAPV
jgi:hypothetical protein